jgi:hypothetical protein
MSGYLSSFYLFHACFTRLAKVRCFISQNIFFLNEVLHTTFVHGVLIAVNNFFNSQGISRLALWLVFEVKPN